MSDWFSSLFGFSERSAEEVRSQLRLSGSEIHSTVNGKRYECGVLEIPTLDDLRQRYIQCKPPEGKVQLAEWVGDVRDRLTDPAEAGATFQVASQFNLLEMIGPHVSPDRGITIYQNDPTQGPACAIACGAGTVYRNYFVELSGGQGQTAERQIDCLADFGAALENENDRYWTMQNGYLLTTKEKLLRLNERLTSLDHQQLDQLREAVRVGVQRNTQVTLNHGEHRVTQVYASAVPVSYNRLEAKWFEPLARLILEAAYEATLLVAMTDDVTRQRPIYLTCLGGGAFGNQFQWIMDAMERAIRLFRNHPLQICFISYGRANPELRSFFQRVMNV